MVDMKDHSSESVPTSLSRLRGPLSISQKYGAAAAAACVHTSRSEKDHISCLIFCTHDITYRVCRGLGPASGPSHSPMNITR